MNRINKILWSMFSTLICAFYNMDARGVSCTYSVASYVNLNTTTYTFSVCSASTLCAGDTRDDCGGIWNPGTWLGNATVTVTNICSAGYYISTCKAPYWNNSLIYTTYTDPTETQLRYCTTGFSCSKCPNSESSGESTKINVGNNATIDGYVYVCSTYNPVTNTQNSGGYLYMFKIKPTCTGGYDIRIPIDDCHVPSNSTRRDSVGSYVFTNVCSYSR